MVCVFDRALEEPDRGCERLVKGVEGDEGRGLLSETWLDVLFEQAAILEEEGEDRGFISGVKLEQAAGESGRKSSLQLAITLSTSASRGSNQCPHL